MLKSLTASALGYFLVPKIIQLDYLLHWYLNRCVCPILLAGDIDQVGLNNLLKNSPEIQADILIFPHHGGNVGIGKEKENQDFTAQLCKQVQPKLVLFSIGRDKHQNPRKEIIQTLRNELPDVHILCTQLSKNCSSEILSAVPTHLSRLPSKGKEANHCCGGTVIISLNETETTYEPRINHLNFVEKNVISALCRSKQ